MQITLAKESMMRLRAKENIVIEQEKVEVI